MIIGLFSHPFLLYLTGEMDFKNNNVINHVKYRNSIKMFVAGRTKGNIFTELLYFT